MAVSAVVPAGASLFSTTNASSYATGIWTPAAAERTYVAFVSAATAVPTLSGHGLAWVEAVAARDWDNLVSPTRKSTVLRARGIAAEGATTVTFPSTQHSCIIVIVELDGVDGAINDGVVQANTNAADTGVTSEVILEAFGSPTNATLAFFVQDTNVAPTPEAGPPAYADLASGTLLAPNTGALVEFLPSADPNPSATTGAATAWAGIALEIKEAVGLTPVGVARQAMWNARAPIALPRQALWDVSSIELSQLLTRVPYNPDPAATINRIGTASQDADAANLAAVFTAPGSGKVLSILSGYTWSDGSAADAIQSYWNLREGAADLFAPVRMHHTTGRTRHFMSRLIDGLTPGQQYTLKWGLASNSATLGTNLQMGTDIGPAIMEIWEVASADLLAHVRHEPDPSVTYTNAATAGIVEDIDVANLAAIFTVPDSGEVDVDLEGFAQFRQNWTLREGTTVIPAWDRQVVSESTPVRVFVRFRITGLTPGQVKTWKWAWAKVEADSATLFAGAGYGPAEMRVWRVTT